MFHTSLLKWFIVWDVLKLNNRSLNSLKNVNSLIKNILAIKKEMDVTFFK